MTTYVLAGGCFWCLDAVYRKLRGVESLISGYTGGVMQYPTYNDVILGTTGHAESVKVSFDESIIPSDVILDIFFLIHDPTTLNSQGADVGTQYRSAMFYVDDTQKESFEAARDRAQKLWSNPIMTEIVPLDEFYDAEDYHQDYYANNPANPYCPVVISPKVSKAKKNFAKWFVN